MLKNITWFILIALLIPITLSAYHFKYKNQVRIPIYILEDKQPLNDDEFHPFPNKPVQYNGVACPLQGCGYIKDTPLNTKQTSIELIPIEIEPPFNNQSEINNPNTNQTRPETQEEYQTAKLEQELIELINQHSSEQHPPRTKQAPSDELDELLEKIGEKDQI